MTAPSRARILFIGHQWPEPKLTAAGWRTCELIQGFINQGNAVDFACVVNPVLQVEDAVLSGVTCHMITLNDDGFDLLLQEIQPQMVVFDRFITEEQYGWRVRLQCPDAVKVLDTQDLHFLRKTRAAYIDKYPSAFDASGCPTQFFYGPLAMRELASIWRCDQTLLISEFEYGFLTDHFSIPETLLTYLPLGSSVAPQADRPWKNRQHFLWVGNRKQPPNHDSLMYLGQRLWPSIHRELPEAELHVIGANKNTLQTQMIAQTKGMVEMDWVDDLQGLMTQYRVNLAPVRFGAGLKGKIISALSCGLVTLTSPIGAEGLDCKQNNGVNVAHDPQAFIEASVRLYREKEHWQRANESGLSLIQARFSIGHYMGQLMEDLNRIKDTLTTHRQQHFMGQILQHQSLNASKYMGRWLTLKNAQINPK